MKNRLFWLLCAGHVLTDFYANFIPALLPIMVNRLGISLAAAGAVVTASSITANFIQPAVGVAFDRKPSRVWLSAAIAVSGLFICFSGLVPTYALFLLFPVIAGLGNGIYHPAGCAYVYQIANRNQGFAMSVFSSMGVLGFSVGPMVAAFFIVRWGVPSLLWWLLPGVIFALLFACTDFNGHLGEDKAEAHENGSAREVLTFGFLAVTLVMVLRSWGHLAVANYLPFFLQERGLSYAMAETVLTVFLLVGVAGNLLCARVSDSYGRKRVLIGTMLASALALGLFVLTRGAVSLIGLMVCGFALQGAQMVAIILAQEMLPNNIGLASGISMGLVWGIGAVGVSLNGLVADHMSLNASYWLAVALLAAGTLLSLTVCDKGTVPLSQQKRQASIS